MELVLTTAQKRAVILHNFFAGHQRRKQRLEGFTLEQLTVPCVPNQGNACYYALRMAEIAGQIICEFFGGKTLFTDEETDLLGLPRGYSGTGISPRVARSTRVSSLEALETVYDAKFASMWGKLTGMTTSDLEKEIDDQQVVDKLLRISLAWEDFTAYLKLMAGTTAVKNLANKN